LRYLPLFLLFSFLTADPWGKDADLINHSAKSPPSKSGLTGQIAAPLIGFHQKYISKTDGPRSHFSPSSSQYTKEAIQKYGLFHGFLIGCDRPMRENEDPWIYETYEGKYNLLKYDPVK